MHYEEWLDVLSALRDRREPCVLLTLLEDKGSVPRSGGTKMVVTAREIFLTIGGGNLEHQCIAVAREMLAANQARPRCEPFQLGARAGQCCGGMITVLFEPLLRPQPQVVVFGAGHVGQALVSLLATLPLRLTWVDEREGLFGRLPAGVTPVQTDDPCEVVSACAPGSYFVVMTHSHPRDLELTEAILRRGDARYCGLIGSQTKRERFDYRLAGKGISPSQLARLRCPVGLADVKGKLPAEIAVAIAGEIIAVYQGDA